MDNIRPATKEEIEKLASTSDLTPTSDVISFGGKDFAVLRKCLEIDPMHFASESNVNRRLIFAMNLETMLRFNGITEVYFNVPVSDEKYRHVIETWGAVPTSLEPEIRYKKVL